MSKLQLTLLAWRKKLAVLLYPIDIIELTRKQFKGVTPSEIDYENGIDDEKKLQADAFDLKNNTSLSRICDKIIDTQINFIAKEAINMDLVAFGRATINGVSLLKEEIERLASIHEERIKRSDSFDPFDLI